MEIVKEILSDKVDYLNALRNAPKVPVAPAPVIEIVETVIHTPVVTEIPATPPLNTNVLPALPKPKKGFTIWHLLGGLALLGITVYAIKKYKEKNKKKQPQQQFNGWR